MGKVISLINVTADGFCGSEYVNADAEFHEYVHGILSHTEKVGFGRNTFELFQGVWPPILSGDNQPAAQVKMAQALNDIDKLAFSGTLSGTTWNNSTIVKKIEKEHVDHFKQTSARDLLTIGSPGIVAALTQMDVVDEYYFSVQSVIAGKGVRLFDQLQLDVRRPLKLVDTRQLKSGVVILHYLKG
ncbi:dihydrofolate reductase family protein [Flavitalea sp. BT771]|uniref:dihydrofolate reductase family protein n=1 Tax=Flavitalea sp. BT771 TaxID=3063329 RepID=UPI0026E34A63|nr:dihydrofolate reductase family protein [Flavitalea sp. BT771]MDO6432797.1 dihydrofolate reductase family protein [Flavitalea sp. BT771]MDV6221927.1 dihydrofolate reductase family protein [Flavitalea sp. BT771]